MPQVRKGSWSTSLISPLESTLIPWHTQPFPHRILYMWESQKQVIRYTFSCWQWETISLFENNKCPGIVHFSSCLTLLYPVIDSSKWWFSISQKKDSKQERQAVAALLLLTDIFFHYPFKSPSSLCTSSDDPCCLPSEMTGLIYEHLSCWLKCSCQPIVATLCFYSTS